MCSLICDTREHAVLIHAEAEFSDIKYSVSQINVGDYAIIDTSGKIIVIIERKSLEDYGASLKDARHSNKEKLNELSLTTGCRIVYIIEGKLSPGPNDLFARIPYRHIESSIFHLIIRDNICVLRTKDTLDTAKTLCRFTKSCSTVDFIPDRSKPIIGAIEAPDECVSGNAENKDQNIVLAPEETFDHVKLLNSKHVKATIDIVRGMWAKFSGISVTSADEYINLMSLSDLISGKIDIKALKMRNGKPPNKRVMAALNNITIDVEKKLLSEIPGISAETARGILSERRLHAILSYDAPSISIITLPLKSKSGVGTRKLGMDKANKILLYFNYKLTSTNAN